MAQSIGYVVASTGPLSFGVARELSGGWIVPLTMLIVLMLPQFLLGMGASRDVHVGSDRAPSAS